MTDRMDPYDPFADIEPYEEIEEPGRGRSRLAEQPPTPPPTPPRSPLLTGLILGLLLVVVSIALFQLLTGGDEDPVAGPDTTTAVTTDGTVTDTTVDGGTSATTAPDGSASTVAPPTQTEPYVAAGDPVPLSELQLKADGVGPIDFGRPADQAVGRLVASLGEPDQYLGPQTSTGEWGVCEGDTERIVQWGPFAAIVVVDPDGTEVFAGYRLDLSYGGLTSETVDMATLSGLQAGSSFRQLEQTYADFDVSQSEDPDLGPVWQLASTSTGNLLLWGPLTADDTVRGIYAPDACGRF